MIKNRVIIDESGKKKSDRNIPKSIKWKGWLKGHKDKVAVNMVRNQSFIASVKEIIEWSDEMDVTRIGIVGDMMSGKSTLAMTISHTIHTYSKYPFQVRVFYRDDLKNFKKTMGSLKPANYILVFDDVSFLKDTSQIEKEVTEIRHMPGGEDVKIILVFNFHYPKALPPFLREFQFKYVTSIGTDNEKTIADNYGKKNLKLCLDFKMMRKKAIVKKFWFERIGPKEPIKYNWRNPFIPVLFWNENNLRKVVSPTRFFMDKICSICNEGEGDKEYNEQTIAQVCERGETNFTKGNFIASVKLLAHANGLTVYGKKIVRSLRWIEKERKMRNMPLEAFLSHYDLTETKTRLRAKPFEET